MDQTYILRRTQINPDSECWLWQGQLDKDGYGQFRRFATDKWHKAHRISWEAFQGTIPEGKSVLHKCHVKNCVNPAHLYIGTQKENMRDESVKYLATKDIDSAIRQVRLNDKTGKSFVQIAKKIGVTRRILRRESICRTR